jgi:myo-inositol 2-dehydrogenase/D-chiro-inositol 1-dehydrogenase
MQNRSASWNSANPVEPWPGCHTDAMSNLRVAVVGVGGMGSFHARTLAALAGVEVATVADTYEPNATRLAAELGCTASLDPLAAASDDGHDAVVIASPDETHPDLAIAALGAGAWVLCEKPLAATVDEARRVVDAELALGVRRIQMGLMREYDPAHVQLVDALGDCGEVDCIRTIHRNVNATRRSLQAIICQSMVHDIHSVRFITGCEITSVSTFGGAPSDGSFRHVLIRAQLDNGGHALIEFDDGGFAYDVSVEVLGRRGDAVTGEPLRAMTRREGSTSRFIGPDWFARFADAYRIQDSAWVESIRAGIAVGPSAWDAFVAQQVIAAAMDSLATGGLPVSVEHLPRPNVYR